VTKVNLFISFDKIIYNCIVKLIDGRNLEMAMEMTDEDVGEVRVIWRVKVDADIFFQRERESETQG
jgi:hypothetical protein